MLEFDAADEHWRFDDEFLRSNWTCIWGRGCLGIGAEIDPTHHLGCCSLGAEFTDGSDAANVSALAACLPDELWQFADAARTGGIFLDDARTATRVVDGACIFLNREGFAGGAGCALHIGALADGEHPRDWKPTVCWELPVKVEQAIESDGSPVTIVRRWHRDDFGTDGPDMAWFCTDTPDAFVGTEAVVDSLAAEIADIVGDEVFAQLRRHMDTAQRRGRRPSP